MYLWDPSVGPFRIEVSVQFGLKVQLGVLGTAFLELGSIMFIVLVSVDCQVDLSKGSSAEPLSKLEVFEDDRS